MGLLSMIKNKTSLQVESILMEIKHDHLFQDKMLLLPSHYFCVIFDLVLNMLGCVIDQ